MNIRDFTFGEISDETCAILAEEASDIGDALPPQRAVDLAACRLLLQQSDGGHDPATVEPYLAEHGEQHAVRLGEEGLTVLRTLAGAGAETYRAALARALATIAKPVAGGGARERALAYVTESLTILRPLAEQSEDHLADLRGALMTAALLLTNGHREHEAAAAAEEAVSVAMRLAESDPATHLDGLASALGIFAGVCGDQRAEAAARSAVRVSTDLTNADMTRLPGHAMMLGELSNQLSVAGKGPEAIDYAEGSVDCRRILDKAHPGQYRELLAVGLQNLGARHTSHGDPQAADAAFEEAIGIWRELPAPDGLASLSLVLGNHAANLLRLDRPADALRVVDEAVDLRRRLLANDPEPHRGPLLTLLSIRSAALQQTGDEEQAMAAAEESVAIAGTLTARAPAAYLPHLAIARHTLARCLIWADRWEEAARELSAAADVYNGYASVNSVAHLRRHIDVLALQAELMDLQGRRAEAVARLRLSLILQEQLSDPGRGDRLETASTCNRLAKLESHDNQTGAFGYAARAAEAARSLLPGPDAEKELVTALCMMSCCEPANPVQSVEEALAACHADTPAAVRALAQRTGARVLAEAAGHGTPSHSWRTWRHRHRRPTSRCSRRSTPNSANPRPRWRRPRRRSGRKPPATASHGRPPRRCRR